LPTAFLLPGRAPRRNVLLRGKLLAAMVIILLQVYPLAKPGFRTKT
jgi:hypothetical protein